MLELIGKKVILKEFSKENLYDQKYYSWLRDLDVVKNLYRMEYLKPIEFKTIEQYVQTIWESENDCLFAIYDKTTQYFIGTHRLGHINWRSGVADIGLMIGDKEYWGRGFATEALELCIEYAFTTLSLRKLIGGTPSINSAMCRCFEKAGFTKEGTKRQELLIDGKYVDHVLYGLLRYETKYE